MLSRKTNDLNKIMTSCSRKVLQEVQQGSVFGFLHCVSLFI